MERLLAFTNADGSESVSCSYLISRISDDLLSNKHKDFTKLLTMVCDLYMANNTDIECVISALARTFNNDEDFNFENYIFEESHKTHFQESINIFLEEHPNYR